MNALVEITVSDSCNKNCSYCFEKRGSRSCGDKFDEWKPLILAACEDVSAGKLPGVDGIALTFWGGEPFIRYDRMLDLIGVTSKYGFTTYHVYTNGTLAQETSSFVRDSRYKAVSDRFFAQVSYDGFPCNEKRRGYGFNDIRDQAVMLSESGAHVSFKATVSYEDIGLMPDLWDSYKSLVNEWPDLKYCPTLDSVGTGAYDINDWSNVVQRLCRREYSFYREHGKFLMSWFDDEHPRLCGLNNRVFLHTDGIQYVCHGCPYSDDARFKIGTADDSSLQFITDRHLCCNSHDMCRGCDATYCVYCNMAGMPSGSLHDAWNAGRACNENICQMYRIFGRYRRALIFALLKGK